MQLKCCICISNEAAVAAAQFDFCALLEVTNQENRYLRFNYFLIITFHRTEPEPILKNYQEPNSGNYRTQTKPNPSKMGSLSNRNSHLHLISSVRGRPALHPVEKWLGFWTKLCVQSPLIASCYLDVNDDDNAYHMHASNKQTKWSLY